MYITNAEGIKDLSNIDIVRRMASAGHILRLPASNRPASMAMKKSMSNKDLETNIPGRFAAMSQLEWCW